MLFIGILKFWLVKVPLQRFAALDIINTECYTVLYVNHAEECRLQLTIAGVISRILEVYVRLVSAKVKRLNRRHPTGLSTVTKRNRTVKSAGLRQNTKSSYLSITSMVI